MVEILHIRNIHSYCSKYFVRTRCTLYLPGASVHRLKVPIIFCSITNSPVYLFAQNSENLPSSFLSQFVCSSHIPSLSPSAITVLIKLTCLLS